MGAGSSGMAPWPCQLGAEWDQKAPTHKPPEPAGRSLPGNLCAFGVSVTLQGQGPPWRCDACKASRVSASSPCASEVRGQWREVTWQTKLRVSSVALRKKGVSMDWSVCSLLEKICLSWVFEGNNWCLVLCFTRSGLCMMRRSFNYPTNENAGLSH